MSYLRKRYGRRKRPLAGITQVISSAADVATIAGYLQYGRPTVTTPHEDMPEYVPATPLGDLASIAQTIGIAADLSADPYLVETVCRIGQLRSLNNNQKPGTCTKTAAGLKGGVGLRKIIVPFRGYIYAQQHKWVAPVAVAAVIGLPLLIGYALGKGSKH